MVLTPHRSISPHRDLVESQPPYIVSELHSPVSADRVARSRPVHLGNDTLVEYRGWKGTLSPRPSPAVRSHQALRIACLLVMCTACSCPCIASCRLCDTCQGRHRPSVDTCSYVSRFVHCMRHVFCVIGGANDLNSLLAAVLQDSPCRMLTMSLSRLSDTRSRVRQIAHVLLSYGIRRHGTCVIM